MLAAGPGGAVGVDADVAVGDLYLHILGLGQHGHGGRRGVDAAAGLGVRHPLDPVDAAFEFQPAEHPVAVDGGDDLLVAAGVALGEGVDLHPPALQGGIALIHAEQVAGEQGRLVAAGAGADLQDGRGVLVAVLGGQ